MEFLHGFRRPQQIGSDYMSRTQKFLFFFADGGWQYFIAPLIVGYVFNPWVGLALAGGNLIMDSIAQHIRSEVLRRTEKELLIAIHNHYEELLSEKG